MFVYRFCFLFLKGKGNVYVGKNLAVTLEYRILMTSNPGTF